MTKEELEKEAENFIIDRYKLNECYREDNAETREYMRMDVHSQYEEKYQLYLAGAEPREKRIAELIALINAERKRQEECDDVHLRKITELEKEIAELKIDYKVLSCSVGDFGELQDKLEEEQRKNNVLEEKISVLLSCKNCPENKGGLICQKEYENKCLTQKIQYIKELQQENAELDCQKNRNKFCYSCANATERCFRNEIGCPCEKYKSWKKENAELKDVIEGYKKIAKWCDKCDKLAELKSENQKWKDEWQEQVQKANDEGYARTLQTIQLTKAKEIIKTLAADLSMYSGNYQKELLEAKQFLSEVEK